MYGWKEVLVRQEMYNDLLREAERQSGYRRSPGKQVGLRRTLERALDTVRYAVSAHAADVVVQPATARRITGATEAQ
jgi:hypothetical protein